MGGVGEVAGADDTSKDSLLAGGKPQIGQDTGGRRGARSYIPSSERLNSDGRVRALGGQLFLSSPV